MKNKFSSLMVGRAFLAGLVSLVLLVGQLPPASVAAPLAVNEVWRLKLTGGRIEDSSPTVANIDADPQPEILIGTTNKGNSPILVALDDNGQSASVKWSKALSDPVYSSPTVADITGDGLPEILVTTGGDANDNSGFRRGSVIAYDRNGNQLWKYDTTDAQGTGNPDGNRASVVVGDVDGDGDVEIVFGSWDRNIYMLNHNGQKVWHYHVADTIWSTAVLADLNKDGDKEIVIGTDITGGGILPDGYHTSDGGFMLILDKNGNKLARLQMNEAIYSSPALADVTGDGTYEVFVGTSFHWFAAGNYTQPYVYGFRINMSGAEWQFENLPGWPQPVARPGTSSPAIADLDGDGDLEIVIGTGYDGQSAPNACTGGASDPDCKGAIYVWHHTGANFNGFPIWPKDNLDLNGFIRSSPVVGDVDGDGAMEIGFAMNWDVLFYRLNGTRKNYMRTYYSAFASPAIGDTDGDGKTNILIGSSLHTDERFGYVYNFEYTEGNSYDEDAMPWPMFHKDAQHSGLVELPPSLAVSPLSILLLHQTGDATDAKFNLQVRNVGGGSLNWTGTVAGADLSLASTGGQASPVQNVEGTVDVANYFTAPGTYSVGSVTVSAAGVSGSPANVPVTLVVGEISRVYVPAAGK